MRLNVSSSDLDKPSSCCLVRCRRVEHNELVLARQFPDLRFWQACETAACPRADKSEAEHKETAARNQILEEKFVGIEGVMEGAPASGHDICASTPCTAQCIPGRKSSRCAFSGNLHMKEVSAHQGRRRGYPSRAWQECSISLL